MRSLVTLTLALAVLASATSARADVLTPPGDLSPTSEFAVGPDLGVDGQGRYVAIWARLNPTDHVFEGSVIGSDGSLGPSVPDISAGEPSTPTQGPRVAANAQGDGMAVWRHWDGSNWVIQARSIATDGSLGGTTHTLSATGFDAVDAVVGLDPDGDATVVWRRNGIVEARHITAGGTVGALRQLSFGPVTLPPHLAVDPLGRATIVWRDNAQHIRARRLAADGTPEGPTHDLTPTGNAAAFPNVVVDSGGRATVGWNRADGTGNQFVQARRIAPDNTLEPTTFDLSDDGEFINTPPRMGVDAQGAVTVAWERSSGAVDALQARRIASDGTLGPVLDLSGDALQTRLAVGPEGDVVAVWLDSDGTMHARRITRDGVPTPTLDGADDSLEPSVAFDPRGNARIVWTRFLPGGPVIQTSDYLVAPGCVAGSAAVAFGTPVSLMLRCGGPGPPALSILAGPSHGSLGPISPSGAVTYTPAAGYSGPDSFTFRATNAGGSSDATFDLMVGAGPGAPLVTPPAVPPSGRAALRLLGGRVTIQRRTGRGRQRVRCANVPGDVCRVRLSLQSRKSSLKLGGASASIPGGRTASLTYVLRRPALKRLRRTKRLRARVTGVSRNRAGAATAIGGRITLVLGRARR
jgi:hypothetical protein